MNLKNGRITHPQYAISAQGVFELKALKKTTDQKGSSNLPVSS